MTYRSDKSEGPTVGTEYGRPWSSSRGSWFTSPTRGRLRRGSYGWCRESPARDVPPDEEFSPGRSRRADGVPRRGSRFPRRSRRWGARPAAASLAADPLRCPTPLCRPDAHRGMAVHHSRRRWLDLILDAPARRRLPRAAGLTAHCARRREAPDRSVAPATQTLRRPGAVCPHAPHRPRRALRFLLPTRRGARRPVVTHGRRGRAACRRPAPSRPARRASFGPRSTPSRRTGRCRDAGTRRTARRRPGADGAPCAARQPSRHPSTRPRLNFLL